MSVPVVRYLDKRANEKFDIGITFLDADDPTLLYVISALVVTVLDDTNTDVTSSLIDGALNSYSGNKAIVWVRNGTAGKSYTVLVKVTMTTGQVFEQKIVLKILK